MGYFTKQIRQILTVGLLSAYFAGCADQNSAAPGEGTDPTLHTHRSFLPVLSGGSLDGHGYSRLSVVDGLKPSRVFTVDTLDHGIQIFDHGHFHTGKYDKAKFQIDEFHMTTLMYSRSDRLFRLDLSEVTAPESVQVSSEAQAASICHETMVRGNDFVNQNNSRLVYRVKAANAVNCDAGVWHLVRLGMSPADPPLTPPATITRVVDGIYHPDTGALTGWVVVENQVLKRYDADFLMAPQSAKLPDASPVTVGDATTLEVWSRLSDRQSLLLRVGDRLMRYNTLTDQATVVFNAQSDKGVLYEEFYSGAVEYLSDGVAVYFFARVGTVATLYRLPIDDANPVATALTTETGVDDPSTDILPSDDTDEKKRLKLAQRLKIGWAYLTNGNVAYTVGYLWQREATSTLAGQDSYAPFQVKMVSKTGSASVAAINTELDRALVALRGAAGKLYAFTVDKATLGATPKMRVIDDSAPASGGTLSDARFVGETYANVFDPRENTWALKSMILQQDRRLISYDPVLGEKRLDIGQFAAAETGVVNFAWSRGHPFGLMTVANYGNNEGAVYYFNADKANSLVSVPLEGESVHHKAGG